MPLAIAIACGLVAALFYLSVLTGSLGALILVNLVQLPLFLAGLATNSCILCTAHDANMRDFKVTVVEDCCAARTSAEHNEALENIRDVSA